VIEAVPSCPLCDGRSAGPAFPYQTFWDGRRFDYLRCGGCGSSFVHPLPTAADFERMYSHSEYHEEYYSDVSEEPVPTRLPEMTAHLKPAGKLLDFGCGNGAFLIAASKAGFRAEGVELEEGARARAAAASNCPVRSLEEVRRSGARYDVIHLGDVLEHLPEPVAAMSDLASLLASGGRFFVEGPLEDNASAVFYASRLFGRLKKALGRPGGDFVPYHLFRTSARAQRRFFEQRHRNGLALYPPRRVAAARSLARTACPHRDRRRGNCFGRGGAAAARGSRKPLRRGGRAGRLSGDAPDEKPCSKGGFRSQAKPLRARGRAKNNDGSCRFQSS
jgi:SAM-dependent methyltransferase